MTQSTIEAALASVLGRLAHDLKNPLAVIIANLHFLETVGNTDQREAASESSNAADRLNHMINDLAQLEVWRSGSRRPLLEKVRLSDIGADIQPQIEPQLGSRQLSLSLSSDRVMTNRQLLGRVLFNLIEHGVRQTPARGTVSVDSTLLEGDGFDLRIRDHGPPFAVGYRPSILCETLPERAEPPSGYRSDQGLALFFAGVAARALGAELDVNNVDEGGVLFLLHFPRSS